jgi:excisionase family DNA binding protein
MSASAPTRPLATVKEVAALLGVDEKTVRRKIAAGQSPAVQLGGRRSPVRVPLNELQRWLYGTPDEAA